MILIGNLPISRWSSNKGKSSNLAIGQDQTKIILKSNLLLKDGIPTDLRKPFVFKNLVHVPL